MQGTRPGSAFLTLLAVDPSLHYAADLLVAEDILGVVPVHVLSKRNSGSAAFRCRPHSQSRPLMPFHLLSDPLPKRVVPFRGSHIAIATSSTPSGGLVMPLVRS